VTGFGDTSEKPTALTSYRGIPNRPEAEGERSRWRRFLEWALPWLKHKWALGEALMEAKVRQEMAQARIMEAQAEQEALKVVEIAARLEEEKVERAEVEVIPEIGRAHV
jgi:hypothetical protein